MSQGVTDATISFIVLGAVVLLFVWNRVAVEIVAIGAALALFATGVLDVRQALAGFGDPAVIFIATLFVVSEGLDSAGVTGRAGQELNARAGNSRTRLLVMMMLLVAFLTALISLNGAVAALLPVVVLMSIRRGPPSQLLMPLVFAAHAGSLLTLTGTPVNVLVSEMATDAGYPRFGFFEFALVGVPLLAGTMAIVVLFGRRLLPSRTARTIPPDLGAHAKTLLEHYTLTDESVASLITAERGVAEIVIPPRSAAIGVPVFVGMTTGSGDLTILAIHRDGADVTKEITLAPADSLLLQGSWDALSRKAEHPDLLVVDQPDLVRRQALPMGIKGKKAIGVLILMVALLATGALPEAVTGLIAAALMVILRVITVEQAYRAISWTTVILVAAMMPLATAMTTSGAAEQLAGTLVQVVGDAGPYALIAGLFLLTATLGQLISNMATALVVSPIAISAAAGMGVSARPLLMAVTVAAAASFLTPVATPVNLMVKEPGGYRFGDYWKLGLPLLIWFFVVAIVLVPMFWRF